MPEKSAKANVKVTIKQSLSQRSSKSNMVYPVRIIDHILGGLGTSQWLQASNHPHAFFHKIHINLEHNSTELEAIQENKELNIQEHTGSGQGIFGTCFGLSIRIHHIILPCRKIRISLCERTRRTTSMVRRGNLFLFLFLSFKRWRLKIQHANTVTKQKYGKGISKAKVWS